MHSIRLFVNDRLAEAADEICRLFETTIAQYEKEIDQSKQEIDQLRNVKETRLEIRLRRTDVQPNRIIEEIIAPKRQRHCEWRTPDLNREPKQQEVKEEREEVCISRGQPEFLVPVQGLGTSMDICRDEDDTNSSHNYAGSEGQLHREADKGTPVTINTANVSQMKTEHEEEDPQAVDDLGAPGDAGMDKVASLAEYLVGLRNNPFSPLTNHQAGTIIALWQNLWRYDKERLAALHRNRLHTRSASPEGRRDFTPGGLESGRRHTLATSAPINQRPDCCRVIECIFRILFTMKDIDNDNDDDPVSRCDLILGVYRKIRQRLLTNGSVMQQTTLQLVEVSRAGLVQWHSDWQWQEHQRSQGFPRPQGFSLSRGLDCPRQDHAGLQGLDLPRQDNAALQGLSGRLSVATEPVPLANLWPPSGPFQQAPLQPHRLPCTATNRAPVKRNVPSPAGSADGKPHNTCRKCGQFKTIQTGHSQYKGTVYCPSVETIPKDEWLKEMGRKDKKHW